MKKLAALLVVTTLVHGCTYQFGQPIARPTRRTVATETREEPTTQSESTVDQDDVRVRVEAHRLCSVVESRTVERRTQYHRRLTHASVASGLIVIGVVLTVAGIVGAARPDFLSDATNSKISTDASRTAAIAVASIGGATAIGAAVPLLSQRWPGVRVQTSTVEDAPSAPQHCATPVDDSGIPIEISVDGRRVPVGVTDASGALEFSPDAFVPRDHVGAIAMIVDGNEAGALDVTRIREARAANALASCTSLDENACDYLAHLRAVSFESSRAAEIAGALAERDWRRLDLAKCAVASSAADCADVLSFVRRNPNDSRSQQASEAIRRGRIHAIESRRSALRH